MRKGDLKFKEVMKVIGKDATLALVDNFGGMSLFFHVPKLTGHHRRRRDRHIREAHAEGIPVRQIARDYGVSTKDVERIVR